MAAFKEGSPPQFCIYFSFLTLTPSKASDQPHDPAVLSLVTRPPPPYTLSRRLAGPPSWSECFLYWESNHNSSFVQPIASRYSNNAIPATQGFSTVTVIENDPV
jgi:hypothetical protein